MGLSAEEIKAALGADVHGKTIKRDMLAVANGFPAVMLEQRNHKLILRINRSALETKLSERPDIKGKYCVACSKPKGLDEFHNCRSFPDGKWPECKVCRNEYNRMFYAANYRRTRIVIRDDKGRFLKVGKVRRRKFELRENK